MCPICYSTPCICATSGVAAQPVADLEAPARTAEDNITTCTGFINARGAIEHGSDCALHRYRVPVPGAWRCTHEYEDGWGYPDEDGRCRGESFYAEWTDAKITMTVAANQIIDTSQGTITADRVEWDGYDYGYGTSYDEGTEPEVEGDPASFMCSECEEQWYPGSPEYAACFEIYRKATA